MRNCQKVACFNEMPDEELILKLNEMDVKIKIVESISDENPHANKIGMLELGFSEPFKYLVAFGNRHNYYKKFYEFF